MEKLGRGPIVTRLNPRSLDGGTAPHTKLGRALHTCSRPQRHVSTRRVERPKNAHEPVSAGWSTPQLTFGFDAAKRCHNHLERITAAHSNIAAGSGSLLAYRCSSRASAAAVVAVPARATAPRGRVSLRSRFASRRRSASTVLERATARRRLEASTQAVDRARRGELPWSHSILREVAFGVSAMTVLIGPLAGAALPSRIPAPPGTCAAGVRPTAALESRRGEGLARSVLALAPGSARTRRRRPTPRQLGAPRDRPRRLGGRGDAAPRPRPRACSGSARRARRPTTA